ncbi:molybdopterin molybdotransferase MoeA [Agromyces sp. SYSU K20354]|uniref:molybdopterin molybdotransferase MoeA n=1 Tax=Agromyces cavernae TaxID=2898659 RepID=UPI001E43FB1C|nr:gephyrin-like molybdotransferase Glp [Agromyces cavernae]MCD2442939.1 molybdopterin molybdotransferase MoeA [Agromyces cavernae]
MSAGDLETVDAHLARVLGAVHPLAPVEVPLAEADGRVLAVDVRSRLDIPLFDNSAMDGYAVRHADVAAASADHPVTLRVVAEVAAGSADDPAIGPGEAVHIMTGAPLPSTADAVVPVEHTDAGHSAVAVTMAPRPGAHVRRSGEDLHAGDAVLASGVRLTAMRVSALAAAGHALATVHPAPRVGVVSTGSELVAPGHPLARGLIPESNSLLLAGLVREAGGEVVHVTSVPDDESVLDDELARCLDARLDLIVLSGGVSVGAHDVVKATLAQLRTVGFHTIAMQPGKPQAFGMLHRDAETPIPVFGLPGNPVATAVSFEAFVRPALLRLQGAADVHRPRITAVATEGWRVPRAKLQFMPVAVVAAADGRPRVRPATRGGSGSHLVGGLAAADGYAIVPAEVDEVRAGDPVTVMLVT